MADELKLTGMALTVVIPASLLFLNKWSTKRAKGSNGYIQTMYLVRSVSHGLFWVLYAHGLLK